MRIRILAAATAVTLAACQPAAEPQPVEVQAVPDASSTAPMDAAPAAPPEPTPQPQAAAPAAAPRAPASRTPRPAPTPVPAPADPMAGHDMSKMDGMTMPPDQ